MKRAIATLLVATMMATSVPAWADPPPPPTVTAAKFGFVVQVPPSQ